MDIFLKILSAIWRFWRHEFISARAALVYVVLFAAVAFLVGSHVTNPQYRELEKQLKESRASVRVFADEISRRNGELKNLRAKNHLNEKTIEMLNFRIDSLYSTQIQKEEEVAFYQRVLSNRAEDEKIVVHGLEFSPSFAPQEWQISALFVRFDRRKTFKGSYYFDVIHTRNGQDTITQQPATAAAFEMNLYYEAQQTFRLNEASTIKNIRITVLDEQGEILTSKELLENEEQATPTNGNGGGSNSAIPLTVEIVTDRN